LNTRLLEVACLTAGAVLAPLSVGQAPATLQSDQQAKPDALARQQHEQALVSQLLAELDRAFTAGDAARYVAAFAPVHPRELQALQQHLTRAFAAGAKLTRTSSYEIVQRSGDLLVALVDAETRCAAGKAPMQVTENFLLALQVPPQQTAPRAILQVEVDPRAWRHDVQQQTFRCEACNYQIGAGDTWLIAPIKRGRSGCMETLALFSLTDDLEVEVSVFVTAEPRAPRTVLRELTATQAEAQIEDWAPGGCAEGLPGARTVLQQPSGIEARLHVLAFGRMLYLLAATGSAAAWQRRAGEVGAIVDSFRLLDPAVDRARVHEAAIRVHGGRVTWDGHTAVVPDPGIELQGPAGWNFRARPGPHLFRIEFECPEGNLLRVSGHAPPVGLPKWCPDGADAMWQGLVGALHGPVERDSGWQPCPTFGAGWQHRELRLRSSEQHALRRLEVIWRGDRLLVLDGRAFTSERMAQIEQARASLRMR
jgi:hypothetical protein